MTKTGHSCTEKTVALASRFSSVLASSQHNGNLDFSSSLNTSMRDALMNSEASLFGKQFVTLLQEISLGWSLYKDPEA